jgi:uncharacterized damage-inducible protein DinB
MKNAPRTKSTWMQGLPLLLAVSLPWPGVARAQAPEAVGDELLTQFDVAMARFVALARAMPAETYTWSPGEGVQEVGQVFMHVARYNYLYPSDNMGAELPAGVALEGMEAVRDKGEVVEALEASRTWVLETVRGMSGEDLAGETRLYGRSVPRWAVLVQLVAHMNQHLGQSIAYARTNGIVPPWSR